MTNPLELSLSQSFELERFQRAIDESKDIDELRQISKTLLQGWFTQRAATQWILKQSLQNPATVSPEAVNRLGFHPHE